MAQQDVQGFPLSAQQRRLWLLQQATTEPVYRAQCAIHVTGNLDKDVLKLAITDVVRSHEILRTRFERLSGMVVPLQVVGESADWVWHEQPAGPNFSLAAEDLLRFLQNTASPKLDLDHPQLQVFCTTLASSEALLVIDLPAISADEQSLRNLVQNIADAYSTRRSGAEYSNQAFQYIDFAEWQNQAVHRDEDGDGKLFWRQHALTVATPFPLPGMASGARRSFSPVRHQVPIMPALVHEVEQLAQVCGVPAAAVVLACWYVLLWRLGPQSAFPIFVSVPGRSFAELQQALGCFEKSVPLRHQFSLTSTLIENVKLLAQASEEIVQWQDSYFLDTHYRPDSDLSGPAFPLLGFQERGPFLPIAAGDLRFAIVAQRIFTDPCDLKLVYQREAEEGFSLMIQYNATVCQPEMAACITERLATLLSEASRRPQAPVGCLGLIGELERHRLLVEWNATATEYPADKCFHEVFEEQCLSTPEVPAIVFQREQLTFRELNERSSELARYLQSSGVVPDTIVGIYLERSIHLLVSILGVLKAGGAYLPLDPAYPLRRIEFMLQDSRAPLVITSESLLGRFPESSARPICIDRYPAVPSRSSEKGYERRGGPANLAYVIYTSGSTGSPKGTLIHHRGLMNYLSWCLRNYHVESATGALVHSSISFDLTITGLFAPLLVGATVWLAAERPGIDGLSDLMSQAHHLSLVKLTPSHLRLLNQELDLKSPAGRVHTLVIGGENLSADAVAPWRQLFPAVSLWNEYGPTETVVGCCVYRVTEQTPRTGSVSIGRPISNMELYVLGPDMELVPTGCPGELYIGGVGLAYGYLNQPGLTASRFVPHPFSAIPGQRLYATGDRACYLYDGNLLYLGRNDDQVKLRGMRIELAEIDAAMLQQANVREAAAAVRNVSGEPRLIGYVVPQRKPRSPLEEAEFESKLQAGLKASLPEHMVPGTVILLEALPLSSNGKVNREGLPAPEKIRRMRNVVPPRNDREKLLTGIWERILAVRPVGIEDDFFALGGDSILCFQVIYQAQQAGIRLTLQQLYRCRTIAALSETLGVAANVEYACQSLVTGRIPLTPVQHWFFEQNLPHPHHFNQAFVLEISERVDFALLQQAMQVLLHHHDALRIRFTRNEGSWRQFNHALDDRSPLTCVDVSGISSGERSREVRRLAAESQTSLHLEAGPLFRAILFDQGQDEAQLLLLLAHHLVVDGVSWRILLEDLNSVYGHLQHGETPRLLPKTTSYKQWAESLERYANGTEILTELAYWSGQQSKLSFHPVPISFPDGCNDVRFSETVSVFLNREETYRLLHEVPGLNGTQIDEVLLAALAVTLCEWMGSQEVLVDLESHGREDAMFGTDLSRTVGWFTAIYPVVLSVKEGQGMQALASVKDRHQAVLHRGICYGLLRYLSNSPSRKEELLQLRQAEISFNYLGQVDAALPQGLAFRREHQAIGYLADPGGRRRYLLEIIGDVAEGQLQLSWIYSSNLHSREQIEKLAKRCMEELRKIISPGAEKTLAFPVRGAETALAEMVLMALRPGNTAPPLFCVHPSGGMATVYSDLAAELPADQPVYAFQSKGWYPGQEPDTSVELMAEQYVEILRSTYPNGPYLLAGWSSGAIIAYEMAQLLAHAGQEVKLLACIDQPPPQSDAREQTDMTLLKAMLGTSFYSIEQRLQQLEPAERLKYALEEAKKNRLVPVHLELSQAERFFSIFRSLHEAVRKHKLRPYPGSMVLFRAQQQPEQPWVHDPSFGWNALVLGGVEVRTVCGNHDSIMSGPHVRDLGAKLQEYLFIGPSAQAEHTYHCRMIGP